MRQRLRSLKNMLLIFRSLHREARHPSDSPGANFWKGSGSGGTTTLISHDGYQFERSNDPGAHTGVLGAVKIGRRINFG